MQTSFTLAQSPASPEQAATFVAQTEKELAALSVSSNRAQWINGTYIIDDTDALEAFTGTGKMDGSAMIAYFQPLMKWLEEQNKGKKCGW